MVYASYVFATADSRPSAWPREGGHTEYYVLTAVEENICHPRTNSQRVIVHVIPLQSPQKAIVATAHRFTIITIFHCHRPISSVRLHADVTKVSSLYEGSMKYTGSKPKTK